MIAEHVYNATSRMSRDWNRDDAGRDGPCGRPFQQIGCIRRRGGVIAMDPNTRTESLCISGCVGHVVLMRKEDVRYATGLLEPGYELSNVARLVYEQVAAVGRDEIGMRNQRFSVI